MNDDLRSEKVKNICAEHIHNGCRAFCPLAEPCIMKVGDTKVIFQTRLNEAAELLGDE